MATEWNTDLVFSFMAINNELLELGMWNVVWRQAITIPTSSVWNIVYKSTNVNMIMFKKFNVDRICIEVTWSSQKESAATAAVICIYHYKQ
jgi:hypothetical protein